MVEIGLTIEGITEKDAGDIIQQIVLDLQERDILVTDYWVGIE